MMDAKTTDADTIEPVPPVTPYASKKGVWGWMLFDWAAQPFHTLLLTFFFSRYFATGVVGDGAWAQTLWGTMLAITGIFIALMAPVLGAVADATGPRKPWVAGFTLLTIIGTAALWWAVPGATGAVIAFTLIAFAIGMIGVEFAAVFNNAMMPDLVPRERLGRLSGSSWALGYLGGVVALIIVLVFLVESSPGSGTTIAGLTPLFGLADTPGGGDRSTGPLSALWMLVFVIPFFLFTPDTPRRVAAKGAIREALADLKQTIVTLPRQRSLFAFLGSSMFYRDALNGLYGFGGVYAGGVLQWSATKLGLFGILAAFTGAVGAWLGGKADDRFGPKAVVSASVIVLCLVSLTIVATGQDTAFFVPIADSPLLTGWNDALLGATGGFASLPDVVFYVCGALIGAFGGALQAASRTLCVDQAEPEDMTKIFGLYALSGKATSFLAPALIALMTGVVATAILGLEGADAQRLGISPIVLLFLIGLVMLPFVKQART